MNVVPFREAAIGQEAVHAAKYLETLVAMQKAGMEIEPVMAQVAQQMREFLQSPSRSQEPAPHPSPIRKSSTLI